MGDATGVPFVEVPGLVKRSEVQTVGAATTSTSEIAIVLIFRVIDVSGWFAI